jgi:type I restriction enzyme S subunit
VGSVLFAKIGEAIRQNHRVIAGCELLVDNNAMAAIPTERVESRYLFHFLRTVDFYALASATTVPALRKSDLQREICSNLVYGEER